MKLSRIVWISPFLFISLLIQGSRFLPSYRTNSPSAPTNSESILAAGGKISLRSADQADLELIPGISSSISLELLRTRNTILNEAKKLSVGSKHRALEKAKGIGEKRSKDLAEYLSVTD